MMMTFRKTCQLWRAKGANSFKWLCHLYQCWCQPEFNLITLISLTIWEEMVVSSFGARGDVSKENSDKIKFPYGQRIASNYLRGVRCVAVGSPAKWKVSTRATFSDETEMSILVPRLSWSYFIGLGLFQSELLWNSVLLSALFTLIFFSKMCILSDLGII